MMAFFLVVHAIICLVLIGTILIQRGRGGGFVEAFSGLESMLGTKTGSFLSKLTSVFSTAFIISCLWLAFLSLNQSRSLMRGVRQVAPPAGATASTPVAPRTEEASTAPAASQAQGVTAAPAATAQPEVPAVNQTAP